MEQSLKLNECHMFIKGDKTFLFLVKSLQLYELDINTYQILNNIKLKKPNEKINIKNKELEKELLDEKILIDINKPVSIPEKNTINKKNKKRKQLISNIVLELANDCNLSCRYCYGDGGSYGRIRELMSYETAKKGIDFLFKNSGDLKKVHVTYFGGEPLMNFSLMKKVTQYCIEKSNETGKKITFSITTNGTIMNDEMLNHIVNNKMGLMISMDGPKHIQDNYRRFENGRGSYDLMIPNIKKLLKERNNNLTVRSTICKPNLDVKYIKDELLKLGFTKVNMAVVDTKPESYLFLDKESMNILLENYKILAEDYIDSVKNNKPYYNNHFDVICKDLYFKNFKLRNCNAAITGIAVGTDGNLYPCHRFMGMEDYIIGNVDNGIIDKEIALFKETIVLNKETCKDCWARHLCGGACLHTCVKQSNTIKKAPELYCDFYRGIYEITLYIYYALKSWDDNFFRKHLEKTDNTLATIK